MLIDVIDTAGYILLLEAKILELQNTLRQARACLLNLQPEERNPMQVQMQKMIHEISVALGEK